MGLLRRQAGSCCPTLCGSPNVPLRVRMCTCHDTDTSALLNTSNCLAPLYWPDSTAGAIAAAQALRQRNEAAAAAKLAALRDKQQREARAAQAQEEERRTAAKAAAQADKQVGCQVDKQQAPTQHVCCCIPFEHCC